MTFFPAGVHSWAESLFCCLYLPTWCGTCLIGGPRKNHSSHIPARPFWKPPAPPFLPSFSCPLPRPPSGPCVPEPLYGQTSTPCASHSAPACSPSPLVPLPLTAPVQLRTCVCPLLSSSSDLYVKALHPPSSPVENFLLTWVFFWIDNTGYLFMEIFST